MGRRSTSINLLAFSVAILSQKPNSRKLAHWAKCLRVGVGQVVSECTSSLNGLTSLRISTLYNVCSVHRGMFSASGGVQYIGGSSVHRGEFSTSGGYHEYIGGIS